MDISNETYLHILLAVLVVVIVAKGILIQYKKRKTVRNDQSVITHKKL